MKNSFEKLCDELFWPTSAINCAILAQYRTNSHGLRILKTKILLIALWYNRPMAKNKNSSSSTSIAAIMAAMRASRGDYKPKPYPHKHSLILWIIFGWILLWIPVFYYSISPKHYWVLGPFRFCRNYKPEDRKLSRVVRKGDLKGKGHDAILIALLTWPFLLLPMAYFDLAEKNYCYLGYRTKNGKIEHLTKTTKIILIVYAVLLGVGVIRLMLGMVASANAL